MSVRILNGDCRDVLATLQAESVHCCVTSPPYWGLRDYGVAGQIGLESTYQDFVEQMAAVFREVRRVLRADGTLWLNLGDSYASQGGPGWQGKNGQRADRRFTCVRNTVPMREASRSVTDDLKPKDLCGIPWRVAFALQADGWWLRQDIIWSKPNPMPESVTDRCTKAHEYLFMLSKSERYHFNRDAIAEPVTQSTIERLSQPTLDQQEGSWRVPGKTNGAMKAVGRASGNDRTKAGLLKISDMAYPTRNKRSVWEVATQPYKESHFATFPPALIEPCILAGCPEFTCSECGVALDKSIKDAIRSSTDGNDLRALREAIPATSIGEGQGAVLQQQMQICGSQSDEAGRPVSMVREAGDTGSEGSTSKLLQQIVRVAVDGEEPQHDQGEIRHVDGICGDLQAGSSEREQGWLRNGASACDGGPDRKIVAAERDCPPQGRRSSKQQRRQSRPNDQSEARQIAEGSDGQNSLSALCRVDSAVPTCPCCGANLARIGAIVPGRVLDCFGGAGTTGLVADRLQRSAILIELNPEYAAMAQRRIANDAPLFA